MWTAAGERPTRGSGAEVEHYVTVASLRQHCCPLFQIRSRMCFTSKMEHIKKAHEHKYSHNMSAELIERFLEIIPSCWSGRQNCLHDLISVLFACACVHVSVCTRRDPTFK